MIKPGSVEVISSVWSAGYLKVILLHMDVPG